MVCHHPAKFGGPWHCCCRDTMILASRVISQEQPIKVPYNPVRFGGLRNYDSGGMTRP